MLDGQYSNKSKRRTGDQIASKAFQMCYAKYHDAGHKSDDIFNSIQIGLFWPSLDCTGGVGGWGGEGVKRHPPPFLKTIEDIDMKLTPLIKHREINLLLLSYLIYDVT